MKTSRIMKKVNANILLTILEDARDIIVEGVEIGFIHPDDRELMIPGDPKPGRYYGLPKLQKPRETWPEGQNIPPLRPIVSGSGTISENLSHLIDEQAKNEVKKLDSYLEDTRHLLQLIHKENLRGPQPPGTVPVMLDIKGMYNKA